MTATRCTCIRDARFVHLVLHPTCPAWAVHLRFPSEPYLARDRHHGH